MSTRPILMSEICSQCGLGEDSCTCRTMFCPECRRDVLAVETSEVLIQYECSICSSIIPPVSIPYDDTVEVESEIIDHGIATRISMESRR